MGRPFSSLGARGAIIACTVIVAAAVLALHLAGRSAICPCGTIELWPGVVQSDANSQQLSAWYSPCHVIPGLLFYSIGWAVFRRWSLAARLALGVLVEGGVRALHLAGRSAICPCGTIELWHGVVQSDENSQQLSDWYSLSHVIHGLLFYAIGWAVFRRWSVAARLTLAVLVEAGWEVLENSPIIIDRYRAVTMAWGYAGDSILNSLSDIGCMAIGFWLARKLPWRASVAFGVALELIALVAIRDNLTLNVLMLV